MSEVYDFLFKCVAVGDGGCGKTAIVVRFSQGFFKEDYKLTIGVEFAVKTIHVKNFDVKLQIWDTGGQDRFQYVRPLYYKGSMGCIVLFDLTNRESFDHVPKWIDEVRKEVGNIPLLLVGNKTDLVESRVVNYDEAKQFAEKLNMYYVESSAKSGDRVQDVFAILTLLMMGDEIPYELLEKKSSDIQPSYLSGAQKAISSPQKSPSKINETSPSPISTSSGSSPLTPPIPPPIIPPLPPKINPDEYKRPPPLSLPDTKISDKISQISASLQKSQDSISLTRSATPPTPSFIHPSNISTKLEDIATPSSQLNLKTLSSESTFPVTSSDGSPKELRDISKVTQPSQLTSTTIPPQQEFKTSGVSSSFIKTSSVQPVEKHIPESGSRTPASTSSILVTCPKCGAQVGKTFKFCNRCGTRISK